MKKDFLVCIDSDGCAFDTMEIKHKECFCPAYIDYFGLQAVSKYAREAWEFVNLYSSLRGIHRLLALIKSLDFLSERKEVLERGFATPKLEQFRQYISEGRALSNAGMEEYLIERPDAEEIRNILKWSVNVNDRIAEMVHGVPPFPHVRDSLCRLSEYAEIVIVSATQTRAVEREWEEHDLKRFVTAVNGQENGTKKEIIASLKALFAPDHILMIGDAPGDQSAAHSNGVLFYPICPNQEAKSWETFDEYMKYFLNGTYKGEAEDQTIAYFNTLLPNEPAWARG